MTPHLQVITGAACTGRYLATLDNINLWQDKDVHGHETVASHSYKVTVMVRVLMEECFGQERTAEQQDFIMRCTDAAMFHDWDEAMLLRDFSHEVKYSSPNGETIRRALDDYVDDSLRRYFDNPESRADGFIRRSVQDDDPTVHAVVKWADWVAMLYFLRREWELGNRTLGQQIERVIHGVVTAAHAADLAVWTTWGRHLGTEDLYKYYMNYEDWRL